MEKVAGSVLPALCRLRHYVMALTVPHYANMPMQYNAIFHGCKNDNFQMKNCNIFLILLNT